MKRNFLTYIFLCILLLGTVSSCKDDLLYGGGIIGEGESVISGTVKFKPLTPALNGTTRTAGNAIKSINSLCVLLYDEQGNLVKKYPLTPASGTTPNEGEYVLSEEKRTDDKTESIGGEDKNLPPAESETPHADFKLTVPYAIISMLWLIWATFPMRLLIRILQQLSAKRILNQQFGM